MIQLSFLGATGGVTGSRFVLDVDGTRILVDCGLFQGRRAEARRRNLDFPIDAPEIHNAVLTHAHIDHSGALPLLVKRGFQGEIFCTSTTADLTQILLRDSGSIHEKDADYLNRRRLRDAERAGKPPEGEPIEPLYTVEDAAACDASFRAVSYGRPETIGPGITVSFSDQGHILGSAAALVTVEREGQPFRILFSGDRGRAAMPILRDPEPYPACDVVLTESTYGDRLHPEPRLVVEDLLERARGTLHGGGRVIIPAFSVGRTQFIVYRLHDLIADGLLPAVDIFIDSPLSAKATRCYFDHPECHDQETFELALEKIRPQGLHGLIHYVEDVQESMALNTRKEPCIVIASSGMCEGGRVLHHLKHGLAKRRNLVLISGFMAEHTLGRKLARGDREVPVLGRRVKVKAHVETIPGLSAHGDRDDLVASLHPLLGQVGTVFVVHGEPEQSAGLQRALLDDGHRDVRVPELGQTVRLD